VKEEADIRKLKEKCKAEYPRNSQAKRLLEEKSKSAK